MAKWVLKFASYKTTDDILNLVESGRKTLETRPYNPKSANNYALVAPGDTLVMTSTQTGKTIEKTAVRTRVYKTITQMANVEAVDKILPGVSTPEQLIAVFDELKKKWGTAYARKIDQYGIVVIEFS